MTETQAMTLLQIAGYFESLEEQVELRSQELEHLERAGRPVHRQRAELARLAARYAERADLFSESVQRFADHPVWRTLEKLSHQAG